MPLAPVKNRARPRESRKARFMRRVRIGVVVPLALVVLIGGGLFAWVWLQKPAEPKAATDTAAHQPVLPNLAAQKLAPNVPIGSSVQSITTPVTPGSNASVTLRTAEGAVCSIKVVHLDPYQKELARVSDTGLADKTADAYGMVTWTWTMPPNAAIATWKADMYCKRDSQSTHSIGEIVVQR